MDLSQDFLEGIPTEEGFSNDFIELSQLGYLDTEVSWCGHKFLLKTLNLEEEIATGKIAGRYEGVAQYKATLTSIIAASVIGINGTPWMPNVMAQPTDRHVESRFSVVSEWYWPTVEFLATEHGKLATRAKTQMDDLQKKFSVSMRTSSDL